MVVLKLALRLRTPAETQTAAESAHGADEARRLGKRTSLWGQLL
jgi:hypothetical protein